MSLATFQRALSDLTASPRLCRSFRLQPDAILNRYNLSARERERLLSLRSQQGLATQCGLYRANRITPVYTLLPLTCFALGGDLAAVAEQFWSGCEDTELQFKQEISRFAAFLKQAIRKRELHNPVLEEILDFELAANTLRFLPRREIAQLLLSRTTPDDTPWLHPLVKVVAFRHEPSRLLHLLNSMEPPPYVVAEGEYYLLLDARDDELVVKRIDPLLGRTLREIQHQTARPLSAEDSEAMVREGFIVRANPSLRLALNKLAQLWQ